MPNYATATIIGHLGRDPEQRFTPDGNSVVNFSLATSRKRKDEETTTWWRVSMFGKRGETLIRYLGRGDPVLVTGEPYLHEYEGKDGQMRQSLELVANDFAFVGRSDAQKGDEVGNPTNRRSETPSRASQDASRAFQAPDAGGVATTSADFDDDIPF